MPLSLKLSRQNKQVVRVVHEPTGERFYARIDKHTTTQTQILLNGAQSFIFQRVNEENLIFDDKRNVIGEKE